MKTSLTTTQKGFTLVEILVALGVFSFVVTGVMSFSAWIIRSVQTEASKSDRNVENLEMLKLFTQPVYFGALSKYPDNAQLKSCMTTDTVECDSSVEYSVNPFDLATNQPLGLASGSVDPTIKDQVFFKVHCPNNALKCDKADYFTVIVKTYFDQHGISFSSIEKQGVVVPEFNNVVTYVPDATLAPGRPINVLLFLDNSNSMAFAKDQIKDALDALINKISKMDVTLGIYTLSTSSYSKPSYYYYDSDGQQVFMTAPPKTPGFVYYELDTAIATYPSRYTNQDPSYLLTSLGSSYRTFEFLSTDSDTVRATKISAVKNLVEYLLANPGAGMDTPLCNLVRLLEAPGPFAPFNFDSMTPTAMFIISNEDDESNAKPSYQGGCQKSETIKWTIDPDYYHYWGKAQTYKMDVEANATMDGAPYHAAVPITYEVPYDATKTPGADCLTDANSKISQIETAFVNIYSGLAWTYKVGDGFTIKKCTVDNSTTIPISLRNLTPQDICQQIANGQKKMQASYIEGSCYENFQPGGTGATGGYISATSFFSSTIDNVVDTTYAAIQKTLGLENLYYTAVVHPDATTCTITPGSQVGTRYMNLAKKPGVKSSVIPVCNTSYTGQMDKIVQWTEALGANDIQLTPSVAANMSGVEIVRSGVTIKLIANVDYQLSGTILIFKTGLLQPNDLIKVYLK